MKTTKERLCDAIEKAGGLKSVRVGSRLFVFTESTRKEAEKSADNYARRTGEMMHKDGACIFYKWSPIERAGKSGSDRYEWHADGNRVMQTFIRVRIYHGVHECKIIKRAFREIEL